MDAAHRVRAEQKSLAKSQGATNVHGSDSAAKKAAPGYEVTPVATESQEEREFHKDASDR